MAKLTQPLTRKLTRPLLQSVTRRALPDADIDEGGGGDYIPALKFNDARNSMYVSTGLWG